MADPIVTRFAPSPTGHLHVGGARTALFNWALAQKEGGTFLLRIEDTDRARSSADAVLGILEDLAWLGLRWGEGPELEHEGAIFGGDPRAVGPFFQAERLDHYEAALASLIEKDLAYPAFETPEELDAMRAEAQAAKRNFRYRRAPGFDRDAALARAEAEPHVIRFRMPEEAVVIEDAVLGSVEHGPEDLDDFVVRKRDGFPTFHLAVVVDDDRMGVTHVLRGQEHLNNTPRHVCLQRALGLRTPAYAHLPVIQNADGSKMSKRERDKVARAELKGALANDEAGVRAKLEGVLPAERFGSWLRDKRAQLESTELAALETRFGLDLPAVDVEDFRRAGYQPEVLCNFLSLLGWSPGMKDDEGRDVERFDRAFLAEHFSPERVGRSNAKFDRAKLEAFQQETIGALAFEDFLGAWRAWCERYDPEALTRLGERAEVFARAFQPRARTLADPTHRGGPGAFGLVGDDAFAFDEKAVAKVLHKGEPSGLVHLAALREIVASQEPFEPASLEDAIRSWCEANELGMGKAAQPLRVAVTGGTVSPGLGETLCIVGREAALRRIDRCLRECAP